VRIIGDTGKWAPSPRRRDWGLIERQGNGLGVEPNAAHHQGEDERAGYGF